MPSFTVRAALLASAAIPLLLVAAPALAQTTPAGDALQEIVVTATRRSEALSKVPVSVTAYDQGRLEQQGVKTVDDLQRLTPGIGRQASAGADNISIRGIASTTGTSTTGIYIDDTPVQSRSLGFYYGNTYPNLFDLDRVEVLRGPQGTLFGAGSEGGTIRFIMPAPSFSSFGGHARAELSQIQDGGTSYELGVAAGGPIIPDKLAFRASADRRHQGGWIDMEYGSFVVNDSTGNRLGPSSLTFTPAGISRSNSNWSDTSTGRLALAWRPVEHLTITPSIFAQHVYTYDNVRDFLAAPTASQPDDGVFVELRNRPVIDAAHVAVPQFPNHQYQDEKTYLPALKVEISVPGVDFVSNTSYLHRDAERLGDFTQTYETSYAGRKVPIPGDYVPSLYTAKQKSFYQELRAQSANADARLTWVVGAFYSNEQQLQIQDVWPNFLGQLPTVLGAVNNGPPFGPGATAYENYYGDNLASTGGLSYDGRLKTRDIQKAAYGQADFKVTDKLKATVGIRYAHLTSNLNAFLGGSNSNLNAPFGKACLPNTGTVCVPVAIGQYKVGAGPFAPAFSTSNTHSSENATTPKFALSYQADSNNLFYATISKGFRPGGAQQTYPGICNAELIADGYVDANGNAHSPTSYKSDSVWSYEVGSKNAIGRVQVATSLYYIKWKNIQSVVRISSCNQNVTDNFGAATAKGGDLQLTYRPVHAVTLDAVVGYTESSFDQATIQGGRRLFAKDSAIPGSPAPFTTTLSGRYDFDLGATMHGYARADYIFSSHQRRTGSTDPNSVSYVPNLNPPRASNLVNGRISLSHHDIEGNIFVDNVLNAHPDLALTRTANNALFTNYTLTPRTFGVQLNYKY